MRELGDRVSIPIHVFGPELHLTSIVPLSLGLKDPSNFEESFSVERNASTTDLFTRCFTPVVTGRNTPSASPAKGSPRSTPISVVPSISSLKLTEKPQSLMSNETRTLVWGMQPKAIQGMLDFDYISRRSRPSVAGMIYPFGGDHVQRFYWGTKEILIPVYSDPVNAVKCHPRVDWVINFASCRSVYESCVDIIQKCPQIKNIAIIAEGVPESYSKKLRDLAKLHDVNLIGPATGIYYFAFYFANLSSWWITRWCIQDW